MISSEISDILSRRLKKLAQSELPAPEIAANIQRLLEAERAQKLPTGESQQAFLLPLFLGCKAHLNLV